MREPRAVVIALGRKEDLGFMLQAAKGLAVQNTVAVTLKAGTQVILFLNPISADGISTEGRILRQKTTLLLFQLFSYAQSAASFPEQATVLFKFILSEKAPVCPVLFTCRERDLNPHDIAVTRT